MTTLQDEFNSNATHDGDHIVWSGRMNKRYGPMMIIPESDCDRHGVKKGTHKAAVSVHWLLTHGSLPDLSSGKLDKMCDVDGCVSAGCHKYVTRSDWDSRQKWYAEKHRKRAKPVELTVKRRGAWKAVSADAVHVTAECKCGEQRRFSLVSWEKVGTFHCAQIPIMCRPCSMQRRAHRASRIAPKEPLGIVERHDNKPLDTSAFSLFTCERLECRLTEKSCAARYDSAENFEADRYAMCYGCKTGKKNQAKHLTPLRLSAKMRSMDGSPCAVDQCQ